MNAPPLEPKAGFNWAKVTWGRPDSVPTVLCSYCSAVVPDDDIPLILWTDKATRRGSANNAARPGGAFGNSTRSSTHERAALRPRHVAVD
jgi:hypothetical protein